LKAKEAKEAVQNLTDALRRQFEVSNEQVNSIRSDTLNAARDIQDKLAVMNGDVAREAQNKIYEIHTKAISKITDETTKGSRALIEAQSQNEALLVQEKAELEKQINKRQALGDAMLILKDGVTDLEKSLTKGQFEVDEANKELRKYTILRAEQQEKLTNYEKLLEDGIISETMYEKERATILKKITELEEEYKPQLERLKEAQDSLTKT